MKVKTKKIVIVSVGICLVALSFGFGFLFRAFGPGEEKVNIWLPDNYQLMNKINSEAEIIVPQQTEDNENYLDVPMYYFKNFFERSKNKIKVSIISDKFSDYYIIYKINCQTDVFSFVVKSTDNHSCSRYHFLGPVRLDQKAGTLLLECKRDWLTLSFLFTITLFVVCVVAIILWPFLWPFNLKPVATNN